MLCSLSIRNIVLIEKLDLQFSAGLCVLTGETGAGKSILLDALGFCLGERASSRLLRQGCEQGVVTAIFNIKSQTEIASLLTENGLDLEQDELILRRVIYQDGKTRCFINDSAVGVSMLKQIGAFLLEVHGQHEQSSLLSNSVHRDVLDQYASHKDLLLAVRESFVQFSELKSKLIELKNMQQKSADEIDFLRFSLKELDELAPKKGEEEELSERRKSLMHKERLVSALSEALAMLQGDVQVESILSQAGNILQRGQQDSEIFGKAIDVLEKAAIETAEAVSQVEGLLSDIESEEESVEYIEDRLFALKSVARKHNVMVDELPEFYEKAKQQLDFLENQDSSLGKLESQVAEARQQYVKFAEQLTDSRIKAASRLEQDLHSELAPLKLDSVQFKVGLEALPESDFGVNGVDKISFLASTNPGTPLAPIAKIASGGELSRFMLAMKVVLSSVKSVPSMIFDEVDTGIGGAVADAVGRRLELLGKSLQVLVVTHQPQVAARGGQHLKVSKTQHQDKTNTSVEVLNNQQRQEELARMLAGSEITNEARAAAQSLLG